MLKSEYKEKAKLIELARALGQEPDPTIVNDVKSYLDFQKSIRENARSSILEDLQKALNSLKQDIKPLDETNEFPRPPSLDDLEEFLTTIEEQSNDLDSQTTQEISAPDTTESEPSQEPIAEQSLADLAALSISQSVKDSFQQPDPEITSQDLSSIQRKIKYLEQWLGKISLAGPGGGAGSAQTLDRATKLITNSYYEITTKDYYIGVNYNNPVTIVLPTVVNNGTEYIIKDESGNAKHNPITVIGTVDNDIGGFILRISNGAVQLLYRNGWRIV